LDKKMFLSAVATLQTNNTLQAFEFTSASATLDDHRRLGDSFGTQYKTLITTRYGKKLAPGGGLAGLLKIATNTTAGAALYDSFVAYHDQHYPEAMAELRGMSAASGVPFNAVFVQNVEEEFSGCASASHVLRSRRVDVDDCSDLMMCVDGGVCAVGHNEDNNNEDLGTLIMVRAKMGPASWVAATYAGELSSGAFAFSRSGRFGYTLNYVGPKDAVCPAAGRGFVSRAALSMSSAGAAQDLITRVAMSSGHNYQLFDFSSPSAPSIHNIEVAPRGLFAVRPVTATPFFHANQYETLAVPQYLGNSSLQ
jgi:hypothetical protein